MPAPPPDPNDRTSGFGPNRHRMEIELMEKRFRERSERHGGGPVATGEIDGRVSDEMRQFFETSTQALQNVVPQLQEGEEGRTMIETTGEIRKKIDEFFSESKAAAAAAPAAAPQRDEAPRKPTWTPPNRGRAAEPAEAPEASAPADDSGQMDLRTALEKLRRHGVSKGNDMGARPQAQRPPAAPVSRAPAPSAPSRREPPPARPALPPRPAPSPAAAPPPQREPSPMRAAPAAAPPAQREPSPMRAAPAAAQPSQREPSPMRAAPAARAPAAAPAEPPARRDPPARRAPPPAADESVEAPRAQPTNERLRQLSQLPPIVTDEISLPPPSPEPLIRTMNPKSHDLGTIRSAPPARRPAPEPKAAAPAAGEAGDSFDSIFEEVQGIVLDTLKVSVNETFAAARATEPELAEVAVPTAEPTSAPISEAVSLAKSQRLSRPEEDEEEEKDEPAPAGPYDWGVKAAPRPKGAWLLDTPEAPAQEEERPKTVTSEIRASAKAAAPATPPSGGGGGGARSYLLRKASDEVKRFQPVLKALRDSNVLDSTELGDKPAAPAGQTDEFVSADSFKDDRPKPEEIEQELSPMRLVEELRRLKRVVQALVDKGIVSAEDLKKSAGD